MNPTDILKRAEALQEEALDHIAGEIPLFAEFSVLRSSPDEIIRAIIDYSNSTTKTVNLLQKIASAKIALLWLLKEMERKGADRNTMAKEFCKEILSRVSSFKDVEAAMRQRLEHFNNCLTCLRSIQAHGKNLPPVSGI